MKGAVKDTENLTERILIFGMYSTGKNMQLVLMALEPGEEIGEEVHREGVSSFEPRKGRVNSGLMET